MHRWMDRCMMDGWADGGRCTHTGRWISRCAGRQMDGGWMIKDGRREEGLVNI